MFIDESFSYYAYDLILPCTSDDLRMCDDFTDVPKPEGHIVAGFDVGRTHDRSGGKRGRNKLIKFNLNQIPSCPVYPMMMCLRRHRSLLLQR